MQVNNESNSLSKSNSLTESNLNINNFNYNKNISQNEISQIFNKVYDSNFLLLINELSISILNLHKSFDKQSNTFKSILKEIENIDIRTNSCNNLIEKIKNVFNEIEILANQFYSDSKTTFRKMKTYRSNIIKNLNINPKMNQKEMTYIHKKSVSINVGIDNHKRSSINDNNNIKNQKIFVLNKEKDKSRNSFNNIYNSPLEKNKNDSNNVEDQLNISNYDSNKSSSSMFSNILNLNKTIEPKKNEIEDNKNKSNKANIKNYIENLIKDIKRVRESINLNIYNDKLLDINKFFEETIISLNDFIRQNNIEINKENEFLDKISLLKEEKEKIKNKLEKYVSEQKIKYTFLEGQIINLSKKELENVKKMKIKEKEFKEKKIKYEEEISTLKNSNINSENKINENIKKYNELKIINDEIKILLEKENQKNNELNSIVNDKNNEIIQIKNSLNELITKDKNNQETNSKQLRELKEKNKQLKELQILNEETKKRKNSLENDVKKSKDLIKDLQNINSELTELNKNLTDENSKIISLKNKINELENEIAIKGEEIKLQKSKNEILNNKNIELEKKNKQINNLIKEDDNIINDMEKEIKELNNELTLKNKEINNLNQIIEEKEGKMKEYINKYENKKDEEDMNLNINENSNKKRKIPSGRNRNNNNEIENVEKKFRYLYRTMENFNTNKNKSRQNSLKSNKTINISNNTNNKNEEKESINRKNTYSSTNIKAEYHYIKDDEINNNKIKDKNIICEKISDLTVTPDNYSIIKCFQLNNKLKWYLFKKKEKEKHIDSKKYSLISNFRKHSFTRDTTNSNIETSVTFNDNYNDFIWLPYKSTKDFIEFGDISFVKESSFNNSEKGEDITEYKSIIKKLEKKIIDKEKEFNKIDKICGKLMQENKNFKNSVEKLIKENIDLNNQIIKYKTDNNFVGVSLIEDDPESSKFIDDKCCEDILMGLNKDKDKDKDKKNSCYSNNLKSCIDMLMTKVVPSENIRSLLASILRQLGCSDQDIFRLLGNYRGVISIPFSFNKLYNK